MAGPINLNGRMTMPILGVLVTVMLGLNGWGLAEIIGLKEKVASVDTSLKEQKTATEAWRGEVQRRLNIIENWIAPPRSGRIDTRP